MHALRAQGLGAEFVDLLQRCWESFFEQSREIGRKMLIQNIISEGAIEDAEPYILLGLPGIVLLRALARSPKGKQLELADGFVVNEEQVSTMSGRVRAVAEKLFVAKEALEAADVDEDIMALLEISVLVGQADSSDLSTEARDLLKTFDEHSSHSKLMVVQSGINDVAIELTRLPMFQSRFDEVLEDIVKRSWLF
jgi:hypothetical protein